MKIGYSPNILVIIIIIIFFYLFYKKKENFKNECPIYCHDYDIFYNMDSCSECFVKGGKYEKTEEELNKAKILIAAPHSKDCPGICNKDSYRYGVCAKCFEPDGPFNHIKEECGKYCDIYSSKTGRCKKCFEPGGRLSDNKKEEKYDECREWCQEDSYRYGICAPCFIKGGKFANIKEPCYEACTEFSSRVGKCANCFKEGGRYYVSKDYILPESKGEYIPFIPPEIPEDLSFNCPHYCTKKSDKKGSCKSCFEKDGIYFGTEDVCYDYCSIFSNPEGECKPCFYKGERLYTEPKPERPVYKPVVTKKPIIKLYSPPPPPKDHSDGCPWYCNEQSYPLGNCSKCFEKDGAFFQVTKKCMNFCTILNKDLELCKPCFEKGERLYREPKTIKKKEEIIAIPIEKPHNCAEWCNNRFLFYNKNYDKYCIREKDNMGKNCYNDKSHIPEKIIEPEKCRCDYGIGDISIECAKDNTIEKCISCNPGTTLDFNNKCILNKCICENGKPKTGLNCPDINKHSCVECNKGYIKVKNKCYKKFNEFGDGIKNQYNPIDKKGYFNLIENFENYSTVNNYIDPTDGGPVTADENMSIAKVENANTLKSCKQNCNIFDTCGGFVYKEDDNECYTMSTSQSWLSRDEPDNLNDIWTTFKRLNPDVPPLPDLKEGEKQKIQYFRFQPNRDYMIRFNQFAPLEYNYNIDINNGQPTNDITKSTHNGNVESCKKKCKSLDNCGGFSYNKVDKNCTLHNNNLSTLSLPENDDYNTYSKINITGELPEFPSCPINCKEKTKENIFRDNFLIQCVRPQNTGKNCLGDYPDMIDIIKVQIEKLRQEYLRELDSLTELDNDKQAKEEAKERLLQASIFNESNAIEIHFQIEEDIKNQMEEEKKAKVEIEAYKKELENSTEIYDDILSKFQKKYEKAEETEKNIKDEIDLLAKRHDELIKELYKDNSEQIKTINQELIVKNARLKEETTKKINQQIELDKIEREKIKEERRLKREKEKEERRLAAILLQKKEKEELERNAKKEKEDAIKKANELSETIKKQKTEFITQNTKVNNANVAYKLKVIDQPKDINEANEKSVSSIKKLENRKKAEKLSKDILNVDIITKNVVTGKSCTDCSTDGTCGNIINQKCYKPCCTRNGKPQYCSSYGFCGPTESGLWSDESLYRYSRNSKCDSKIKTCNDYNPKYKVDKNVTNSTSTVKLGSKTLSANLDAKTIDNKLDQVHKAVKNTRKVDTKIIVNQVKTIRPDGKVTIVPFVSIIKIDEMIKTEQEIIQESEKVRKEIESVQQIGTDMLLEEKEKREQAQQERMAAEQIIKLEEQKIEAQIEKEKELQKEKEEEEKIRLKAIADELFAKKQWELDQKKINDSLELEAKRKAELRARLELERSARESAIKQEREIARQLRLDKLRAEAILREKKRKEEEEAAAVAARNKAIEDAKKAEQLLLEKKAEAERKKQELEEEKKTNLIKTYETIILQKKLIDDEALLAEKQAYRIEQAKKAKKNKEEFEKLASGPSDDYYKLESAYPDPELNSKELRNKDNSFVSIKYRHIATMALYNHLISNKRKVNGDMTVNLNTLKSIKAEDKSPYTGYDASITGIYEINEELKSSLNSYISHLDITTSYFKIYNSLQIEYNKILELRKKVIEQSSYLGATNKIVWPTTTSFKQKELDTLSDNIPKALNNYLDAKTISDKSYEQLIYKVKREADILKVNQDSSACRYTKIQKTLNKDGKPVCCEAENMDKNGNCCHLQEVDCQGVCGGNAKLDACGACGGNAIDNSMCAESTHSNNYNRNLAGTQNSFSSSGGDTRTYSEKILHEKEENIQRCECPGGWPHGMVYNLSSGEPIKWPSRFDTSTGCTKQQPIKCRGYDDSSFWREDNGNIKNYCKHNFIPRTALVGEPITQKHLEDSKFLGCKVPKNNFSCPNGIAHDVNYSNTDGYVNSNIWVPVGLEKPTGTELKNSVLSALLDTKTSFTSKEWLDISESFDNKGIKITNRHFIKAINDIYYKPFSNKYPLNDGEINCKSCNDGYILEMKIPTGRTCALGMGCPPPVGKCIKKQKECACFDPQKPDNSDTACYDGAFRELGMAIKFNAGGGRKEISRVGKCHKCYSGKGPWQDPARGSTNTNDTGINCTTDADCAVEWIGKWDNMPDVDNINTYLSPTLKPNVLDKNKHKSVTHRLHHTPTSEPYSFEADYVLRDNQDKLADNTKAYGRNYKCIKHATYDNRNLTTTGKCCFGFRPIEANTPQLLGNEHRSSNACKRDGQMKCDAEKCQIPVQINYDQRARWASTTQSLPRRAWGGYNKYTKKCEKYIYNTENTLSNNRDTRIGGCNRKYLLIDGRQYTDIGRYGCSATDGGKWNIPDTPKDRWLRTAELDKVQTIDTTISDDTSESQLTAEQKRREKYAVDKSGNFIHETSWNSPEANASYWNKGEGMGNFDPNKIKLVYY